MNRVRIAVLTLTGALLAGTAAAAFAASPVLEAFPVAETEAVAGIGDGADDPAIWVNPADPALSLVLGTDKEADQLEVYDLTGRRLQRLPDRNALLNNVDVQGDFPLGGKSVGLVATSGSDIGFFAIDPTTRHLTDVTPAKVVRGEHGAAGICLYRSPLSGKTYVFIASADGYLQQFEVSANPDGTVRVASVRGPWDVNPAPDYIPHDGEVESCAVDDETATLYVAEQAIGVWAYGAEPTDGTDPAARTMVVGTATYNGGPAAPDLEGLAVVAGPDGSGWVIVSSQGISSYVVVERAAPYTHVGTVVVNPAGQVDGCTRTDGIDAVAADLGGYFERGLFVCQDDKNTTAAGETVNQNFKFVPLDSVVPLPGPDRPVPPPTTTTTVARPPTLPPPPTDPTTTSTTTVPPTTTTTTIPAPIATAPPADEPEARFRRAGRSGYWMIDADARVYRFGGAADFAGPAGHLTPDSTAVDLEPTPTGTGAWILADNGRVHPAGDATPLGDLAGKLRPDEQAAALSATPSGRGYWIFTDRGRVAAFGDAPFLGDMAATHLNQPVLDSVATPSGQGYWMVASDGGIFSFGDATFAGSTGDIKLNQPVMSMAPDPDGAGYWLVASDGGIFAFDAGFHGSMGATRLNKPISGMVPGAAGYLMVAEDGGIFAFGDVTFHGSLGATPPPRPIVAVALAP